MTQYRCPKQFTKLGWHGLNNNNSFICLTRETDIGDDKFQDFQYVSPMTSITYKEKYKNILSIENINSCNFISYRMINTHFAANLRYSILTNTLFLGNASCPNSGVTLITFYTFILICRSLVVSSRTSEANRITIQATYIGPLRAIHCK